jgi:hypothetical protein
MAAPATEATRRTLDELSAGQLEALYAELEIIQERIGDLLEVAELGILSAGLKSAKRAVYAHLASPVQRLMDGDR